MLVTLCTEIAPLPPPHSLPPVRVAVQPLGEISFVLLLNNAVACALFLQPSSQGVGELKSSAFSRVSVPTKQRQQYRRRNNNTSRRGQKRVSQGNAAKDFTHRTASRNRFTISLCACVFTHMLQ